MIQHRKKEYTSQGNSLYVANLMNAIVSQVILFTFESNGNYQLLETQICFNLGIFFIILKEKITNGWHITIKFIIKF